MLMRFSLFPVIIYYLCLPVAIQGQLFNVTKCFVCEERAHYDCVSEEYIRECPRTYNGCQGKVIIINNEKKKFERSCALMPVCESLKSDWLSNGFCHGHDGSMCLDCCQGDLCNSYDPTERLVDGGASLDTSYGTIVPSFIFFLLKASKILR